MRPCLVAGGLLAALAAGCASTVRSPTAPAAPAKASGAVRVVNLQAMPTAVNWDDKPGPDGLRVRVYLFRGEGDQPDPVLGKGSLEFRLYEGALRQGDLAAATPIRTWSFDPAELAAHTARGLVGWHYAFALGWGADVPAAGVVTLLARYLPRAGEPAASAPITITMKMS
jgi:hypothetical protein